MYLKISWSVKTPGYGLTLCYIYDQLLVPWKRDLLIFIFICLSLICFVRCELAVLAILPFV